MDKSCSTILKSKGHVQFINAVDRKKKKKSIAVKGCYFLFRNDAICRHAYYKVVTQVKFPR